MSSRRAFEEDSFAYLAGLVVEAEDRVARTARAHEEALEFLRETRAKLSERSRRLTASAATTATHQGDIPANASTVPPARTGLGSSPAGMYRQILDFLAKDPREAFSVKQVHAALGRYYVKSSIYSGLARLAYEGKIHRPFRGRYRLLAIW